MPRKKQYYQEITMQKIYIIVLSSFIACTSMGMHDAGSSEPKRYIPTLFKMATDRVQKNVHQEVQRDRKFLRDTEQLNAENVKRNIKNEIALLDLPEELSEKVMEAYVHDIRWEHAYNEKSHLLDHKEEGEPVEFCNANSDASQIAVIVKASHMIEGVRIGGVSNLLSDRSLYLWRENPESENWTKKFQATLSDTAEDVVWSASDNELCVASRENIAVFAREKSEDDFKLLHTMPIARFRGSPERNVSSFFHNFSHHGSGVRKMEELWECFGRFAWNHDKQELAVETTRDPQKKISCLEILTVKDDGTIRKKQAIDIPISSNLGINAIDWHDNGNLHVTEADVNKNLNVSVWQQDWNDRYVHYDDYIISQAHMIAACRWRHCDALAQGGKRYTFSQMQKDNYNSIGLGATRALVRHRITYFKNMIFAVRSGNDGEVRAVCTLKDCHGLDKYGYLVKRYGVLSTIAEYMSQPHEERQLKHERQIFGPYYDNWVQDQRRFAFFHPVAAWDGDE
jgi:hypothetical protein